MKKIIFPLIALVALVAFANIGQMLESNDPAAPVFTTQLEDGSTNVWTQADLVQALGLLNRKYHRDCKSPAGRKAWHGKLSKEVVNTNAQTKTEIYSDGTSFTYKFKVITPEMAVSNANKRVMLSTNGVPARIAAARARRMKELQTTNVINQVLKAGE